MRWRTGLIAAVVVAALVGLATLGLTLTQLDSTHETQVQLLSEAKQLAQGVQDDVSTGKARESLVGLRTEISVLTPPLHLQGGAVLAMAPDGALYNLFDPRGPIDLPSGLSVGQVETPRLIMYESVTGHSGRRAWATVLLSRPVSVDDANAGGRLDVVNLVVVLTREAPPGLGTAGRWFFATAFLAVVAALLAAYRLRPEGFNHEHAGDEG